MNLQELKQKCEEFKAHEGRASFYDSAVEIVDQYPLQASIIILATWNVSRFRFMVSDPQNLNDLVAALEQSKPILEKLKGRTFLETDFGEIEEDVKQLYSMFSKVKGVEYTGASKVLHLLNRGLFVMWDGYIRDEYGYGTSADDYTRFLTNMQKRFSGIEWTNPNKTLAKAVDEYNYVTISLPELEKRRDKK